LKKLSAKEIEYLRGARVARLGTSDRKGNVQIVPVVFATDGESIYSVVDRKQKRTGKLKRLSNIEKSGKATLLIDEYSEDWMKLSYLMIRCKAQVLGEGEHLDEKKRAKNLLLEKYRQYREGNYFPHDLEKAVFVELRPERTKFWQNLHVSVS
jgi:PPOX class probable F420-dependent enzyme